MQIGDKHLVMGVVNVTPDSFSDSNHFFDFERAILQVELLAQQAADIIDIGGQSSGPGSSPCGKDEELRRIQRVVAATASRHVLSIDTYHASVAEECLRLGARYINDISALRYDQDMAAVIRDSSASIILMYSKELGHSPHVSSREQSYTNIIQTIRDFLSERIDYALQFGIKQERIILDPGMGAFISNQTCYSWELIERLAELKRYFNNFRLLVGVSRKGFLGGPLDQRDPISQLIGLQLFNSGASIVRTHNVSMMKEFLRISQSL